jgi:hypothetical protein
MTCQEGCLFTISGDWYLTLYQGSRFASAKSVSHSRNLLSRIVPLKPIRKYLEVVVVFEKRIEGIGLFESLLAQTQYRYSNSRWLALS